MTENGVFLFASTHFSADAPPVFWGWSSWSGKLGMLAVDGLSAVVAGVAGWEGAAGVEGFTDLVSPSSLVIFDESSELAFLMKRKAFPSVLAISGSRCGPSIITMTTKINNISQIPIPEKPILHLYL